MTGVCGERFIRKRWRERASRPFPHFSHTTSSCLLVSGRFSFFGSTINLFIMADNQPRNQRSLLSFWTKNDSNKSSSSRNTHKTTDGTTTSHTHLERRRRPPGTCPILPVTPLLSYQRVLVSLAGFSFRIRTNHLDLICLLVNLMLRGLFQ